MVFNSGMKNNLILVGVLVTAALVTLVVVPLLWAVKVTVYDNHPLEGA